MCWGEGGWLLCEKKNPFCMLFLLYDNIVVLMDLERECLLVTVVVVVMRCQSRGWSIRSRRGRIRSAGGGGDLVRSKSD